VKFPGRPGPETIKVGKRADDGGKSQTWKRGRTLLPGGECDESGPPG